MLLGLQGLSLVGYGGAGGGLPSSGLIAETEITAPVEVVSFTEVLVPGAEYEVICKDVTFAIARQPSISFTLAGVNVGDLGLRGSSLTIDSSTGGYGVQNTSGYVSAAPVNYPGAGRIHRFRFRLDSSGQLIKVMSTMTSSPTQTFANRRLAGFSAGSFTDAVTPRVVDGFDIRDTLSGTNQMSAGTVQLYRIDLQ